jgi:low affinity Fe/Cu permease
MAKRRDDTHGRPRGGAKGDASDGESGRESGRESGEAETSFSDRFRDLATAVTRAVGTVWALGGAIVIVAVWAVTGPLFGFSDTWQLVINTGTTIITFLMVFVIQNSQNRESKAMHIKLDELIRATTEARDRLITEEDRTDEEIERDEESMKQAATGDEPSGD